MSSARLSIQSSVFFLSNRRFHPFHLFLQAVPKCSAYRFAKRVGRQKQSRLHDALCASLYFLVS